MKIKEREEIGRKNTRKRGKKEEEEEKSGERGRKIIQRKVEKQGGTGTIMKVTKSKKRWEKDEGKYEKRKNNRKRSNK